MGIEARGGSGEGAADTPDNGAKIAAARRALMGKLDDLGPGRGADYLSAKDLEEVLDQAQET